MFTNSQGYSFQGQEHDDEVKGHKGTSINYKYRMHDPRVGRFFAVDPLSSKYPWYTPYQFSGNKVIHMVELEGLEEAMSPIYSEAFSAASHGATTEEMQEMMNYFTVGYASGLAIIFMPAAISGFLPATETALINTAVWASNPANQALMIEGAGFVGALFYDGPENLSPGGGDELGKVFRKTITPAVNAVEYLFKSGTTDEISTGTAKVVNGILELDFHVPSELRGKGIGTVMFNDAVKNLDDIKGVQGFWVDGDNLSAFNKAISDGKSAKEAVFSTPTGKWAKDNGFTEINWGANSDFNPDNTAEAVHLVFSKPKEQ